MEETLNGLVAEFAARATSAKAMAEAINAEFSARMVTAVKQAASGPPGPNVVTGKYVESISATADNTAMSAGFGVGSDAPQAMRLEYGFVGTDSAGRTYDQAPFPHFRPVADRMEVEYEEAMAALGDLDAVIPGFSLHSAVSGALESTTSSSDQYGGSYFQ
jgi:hypothetical protein